MLQINPIKDCQCKGGSGAEPRFGDEAVGGMGEPTSDTVYNKSLCT